MLDPDGVRRVDPPSLAAAKPLDWPLDPLTPVHRVEELTGAPVSAIGVGPGRDETITRDV